MIDRLAVDDLRRGHLDWTVVRCLDLALTVNRVAQRVHHAAQKGVSDRDARHPAAAADNASLADLLGVAKEDAADFPRL